MPLLRILQRGFRQIEPAPVIGQPGAALTQAALQSRDIPSTSDHIRLGYLEIYQGYI